MRFDNTIKQNSPKIKKSSWITLFVVLATVCIVLLARKLVISNTFFYRSVLPLKTKGIILIGDSYGTDHLYVPNSITNDSQDGWIGWEDQFCIKYPELNTFCSAIGGAGFVGAEPDTSFFSQLTKMNVSEVDNVSDIIVVGGHNDISYHVTKAEITESVTQFYNYASRIYPNASICVIYAPNNIKNQTIRDKIPTYSQYYRYACELNNITFIDGSNFLNDSSDMYLNKEDIASGFHPSTKGAGKIADQVAIYLMKY